ncbi:unnamed protein product, partial [Ectocarpus fasciculatus]
MLFVLSRDLPVATQQSSMAEVLYGDYNGYLRPLSLMYFSLDSRCLVADHPRSVQEEVESHFCPHCTSFFRTPDAMSTENRCPHCFECPCCRSVLVPSPVSLDRSSSSSSSAGPSYCLRCLYCQWTSEDSGLVAPDPAGLAAAAAAAAAAREKKGGGSSTAMVVGALLEAAQQREAEAAPRARSAADGGGRGRGRDRGRGARLRAGSANSGGGRGSREVDSSLFSAAASTTGPWKVSDLDEAVARRNQVVAAASRSVSLPRPPATTATAAAAGTPATVSSPWALRGDTDGPDPALWALASRHETAGLAERVEGSWSSPRPRQSTPARGARKEGGGSEPAAGGGAGGDGGGVPRRVRLRARLGKRCRKDLAAGRTGILIKATFNPLDGDSSTAK